MHAQEEQVLLCSFNLKEEEGQPDWFSLKDLADKVNESYNRKVSSSFVSNILTRLGITRRKRVKGYTLFYCPKDLLEESAKRIGLPLDATCSTQSTNSTQQQEPAKEWLEGEQNK